MKIVLNIPDSIVGFIMKRLRNLSFVKTNPLPLEVSTKKALFLAELGEAVGELNDVLAGKMSAQNAYDLLDGL